MNELERQLEAIVASLKEAENPSVEMKKALTLIVESGLDKSLISGFRAMTHKHGDDEAFEAFVDILEEVAYEVADLPVGDGEVQNAVSFGVSGYIQFLPPYLPNVEKSYVEIDPFSLSVLFEDFFSNLSPQFVFSPYLYKPGDILYSSPGTVLDAITEIGEACVRGDDLVFDLGEPSPLESVDYERIEPGHIIMPFVLSGVCLTSASPEAYSEALFSESLGGPSVSKVEPKEIESVLFESLRKVIPRCECNVMPYVRPLFRVGYESSTMKSVVALDKALESFFSNHYPDRNRLSLLLESTDEDDCFCCTIKLLKGKKKAAVFTHRCFTDMRADDPMLFHKGIKAVLDKHGFAPAQKGRSRMY